MSTSSNYTARRADQAKRQRLYETVGWRIRLLRHRENMTIAQLARAIGCGPNTLAGYEAGGAQPLHVLVAIAEEVDCALDDFLTEPNDEERCDVGAAE